MSIHISLTHNPNRVVKCFVLCLTILMSACQKVPGEKPYFQTLVSPSLNTLPESKTAEFPTISNATIVDTSKYIVQERMTLVNEGPGEPSKQNLWIALIRDIDPYQKVTKRKISPAGYRVFFDEYDNLIAEFDFSKMPFGSEIEVIIEYEVSVNRLEYDLSECFGELPNFFTTPELHIEADNPQISNLAKGLSSGKRSACDQSRAFYDYVGNNLVYSFNGKNWGAQAALGPMGADCTEYASLMIALNRASGIPARYLEGLYYTSENGRNLASTEHAWLEVYLPGIGWTPMDPTLGRSTITHEDYFAKMTPDHIIVSRGRNPSVLRGANYFTHIYWPGDSTVIKVADFAWKISKIE